MSPLDLCDAPSSNEQETAGRMRATYLLLAVLLLATRAGAGELPEDAGKRLLAAYPGELERIEGGVLVWRDGTRMPLDDGKGAKPFAEWLDHPDIEDMLAVPYPAGDLAAPPAKDVDPGRARNEAFFNKVYGDCRKGEVEKNLASVVWLPKKTGQKLPFSKINGAAKALDAVSRELDELPAEFDVYLFPSAGTYNCRVIAGTTPRLRAWPRHRHRHRAEAFGLLAQHRARQGRRLRLQERDPHGDRAHLREARVHLGRQMAPLRHDAFRVPAGAFGGGWRVNASGGLLGRGPTVICAQPAAERAAIPALGDRLMVGLQTLTLPV